MVSKVHKRLILKRNLTYFVAQNGRLLSPVLAIDVGDIYFPNIIIIIRVNNLCSFLICMLLSFGDKICNFSLFFGFFEPLADLFAQRLFAYRSARDLVDERHPPRRVVVGRDKVVRLDRPLSRRKRGRWEATVDHNRLFVNGDDDNVGREAHSAALLALDLATAGGYLGCLKNIIA